MSMWKAAITRMIRGDQPPELPPLDTATQARFALAQVAHEDTAHTAHVRRAVHARYPTLTDDIDKSEAEIVDHPRFRDEDKTAMLQKLHEHRGY